MSGAMERILVMQMVLKGMDREDPSYSMLESAFNKALRAEAAWADALETGRANDIAEIKSEAKEMFADELYRRHMREDLVNKFIDQHIDAFMHKNYGRAF